MQLRLAPDINRAAPANILGYGNLKGRPFAIPRLIQEAPDIHSRVPSTAGSTVEKERLA